MRYAGNSKDVPTSSSTLPIRQAPARSTADGNANETLDSEHEALNSYFEWETRMLADEDRDYERLRDRVAARMNLTEELQRSDKILQCLDDNILKLMRSEVRVPQVSPTPARHSNAVADDATPQITVFTVDNRHAIASWAQAWAYEAPTSGTDVRHWTSIYRSLVSTLPSSQFIMFAAKAPGDYNGFSDNIVGTGYLHMYAGVAAMHSIVVRPQYRHRGIGARLVEHGMQLAKQKGYNMVMLTATRSGLPLFRKAGFKEFGRCKQYVWRPLKENYGPAPQRPAQWKQPEVKVEMNAEAGPKQDSNKTEDAGTHTAVDEQPGGCETSHDPVNESDVEFICYDSDSEDWEVLHT
ncbi:acyl-CoA N-acyltransferase [Xylariomycetidae sp. FL2044]|nr:acyl-CoA N-acyltransferase [Xylariomycetidae sp. FL2044]